MGWIVVAATWSFLPALWGFHRVMDRRFDRRHQERLRELGELAGSLHCHDALIPEECVDGDRVTRCLRCMRWMPAEPLGGRWWLIPAHQPLKTVVVSP